MNAECRRGLHSFKDYGYWCRHTPKHEICICCDLCGFEDVERSDNESATLGTWNARPSGLGMKFDSVTFAGDPGFSEDGLADVSLAYENAAKS